MEATFINRHPDKNDKLAIGYLSLESDEAILFASTLAWNWQEGCRLQWMPNKKEAVIYNDRSDGKFVSIIHHTENNESTTIPKPIYALHPSGREALTLNFARLSHTRPGYGYAGTEDDSYTICAPKDDGIWLIDIATGKYKLIISLSQMYKVGEVHPNTTDISYFQHIVYNPSGEKFVFLHRWFSPGDEWFYTRMLTANRDGSELQCIAEGFRISHFTWLDNDHLMAWFYHPQGTGFYRVSTVNSELEPIGHKHLKINGHCNAAPNGSWIVTDTYAEGPKLEKKLLLYNLVDDDCTELCRLASIKPPERALRCDFHARWNRTGNQLCIDSTHEGSRQMYLLDLSSIIR
jgi:hypothetical protein